jgi:hypothetical protein
MLRETREFIIRSDKLIAMKYEADGEAKNRRGRFVSHRLLYGTKQFGGEAKNFITCTDVYVLYVSLRWEKMPVAKIVYILI